LDSLVYSILIPPQHIQKSHHEHVAPSLNALHDAVLGFFGNLATD
jgi:hypothetical protein